MKPSGRFEIDDMTASDKEKASSEDANRSHEDYGDLPPDPDAHLSDEEKAEVVSGVFPCCTRVHRFV